MTPEQWSTCLQCGIRWLKLTASLFCVYNEYRTSLCACQTRIPPEDMLSPQVTWQLAQRSKMRKWQMWIVGTWNVWSMIDTEGSVAIACTRQDSQRGEDRKVDLRVGEMKRYNVRLQETKWFNNKVQWCIRGYCADCRQMITWCIQRIPERWRCSNSTSRLGRWSMACHWKAWSPRVISAAWR